jgi:hypothetical protein
VWAGIVGDSLVGSHVLPHRLTGNHYRAKAPGKCTAGSQEYEYGTCIILSRHILGVLCEMFSITPIVTDGLVEEDPLHGLHDHQIRIFWIFTFEDT